MKLIIFLFILTYSFSQTINDTYELDIIYLEKYGMTNTTSENGGICLHIKSIDIDTESYLDFSSNDGSINETLKYEYLDMDCYINYTYNITNSSLIPINPDSHSSSKNEFTYEYEFKKYTNSSYLFVVYTNYTGTRLNIIHLKIKTKTKVFILLGILAGFTVLLILLCFCCYKCCKRSHKEIENQYQETILGPVF